MNFATIWIASGSGFARRRIREDFSSALRPCITMRGRHLHGGSFGCRSGTGGGGSIGRGRIVAGEFERRAYGGALRRFSPPLASGHRARDNRGLLVISQRRARRRATDWPARPQVLVPAVQKPTPRNLELNSSAHVRVHPQPPRWDAVSAVGVDEISDNTGVSRELFICLANASRYLYRMPSDEIFCTLM
jgi:hypothetical protein